MSSALFLLGVLCTTLIFLSECNQFWYNGKPTEKPDSYPTYEILPDGERLQKAFDSGIPSEVDNLLAELEARQKEWDATHKDNPTWTWEKTEDGRPDYGPLRSVINSIINQNREIPLMVAARVRPDLVSKIWPLTSEKEARSFTNHDGKTASLIATAAGNLEAVKYFFSKNENWKMTDTDANSHLHLAARWGHLEVTKFLTEKTAGLYHWRNHDKLTPLGLALTYGHDQVALHLLAHGSQPIYEVNEIKEKIVELYKRHPKKQEL